MSDLSELTVTTTTPIAASWGNKVAKSVILTYASAAARDSAITGPNLVEGMHVYLLDVNRLTFYDGTAWRTVGPTVAVKPTDQTVNNTAAEADDTDLVLPVEANNRYIVEGLIAYTSGSTPDIRIGFAVPAGATLAYTLWGHDTGSTTPTGDTDFGWTASVLTGNGRGGTGASLAALLKGVLTVAGTAGTLRVRWAQLAATVANTTVHAGSYLSLTQII